MSSGGHDANVSGGTLIPRDVDGGGDTATISKKSGTAPQQTSRNIAARTSTARSTSIASCKHLSSTPLHLHDSMPPCLHTSCCLIHAHASVPLHACTPARFRTSKPLCRPPTCLRVGHTHPRASAPPYLMSLCLHMGRHAYTSPCLHPTRGHTSLYASTIPYLHASASTCAGRPPGLNTSLYMRTYLTPPHLLWFHA